jgi:hypothetical protein
VQNSILLVYHGEVIPAYVFANLKYLKKHFKSNDIYFVSDNNYGLNRAARIGAIPIYHSLENEELISIKKSMSSDLSFRDGFWWKTSSRVIAVCDIVIKLNCPVLHLESDVVLFPNFPFEALDKLDHDLAFPLASENLGVASLLYLRDSRAAENLRKQFIQELKRDPLTNDMKILGNIAKNHKSEISILPTVPILKPPESVIMLGISNNHYKLISDNYVVFQGCVDGMAYGVYFLGEDPRNTRGYIKLFQFNYETNINLTGTRISINVKDRKVICIEKNGQRYKLYALHVHSKNLLAFNFTSLRLLLIFRSIQSKYGPRKSLSIIRIRYKYYEVKHKIKLQVRN